MTWLTNNWYMAGWAHELSVRPIARRICGIPVLVFRDTPSTVAALHDRCPHRFAPLSFGGVQSGQVQCRYHGLAFDRNGVCVANPHGAIPAEAQVRSFPVSERGGAVWLWMGDAPPDEASVPDFPFIDRMPATATSQDYLHVRAHYLIVVDNIVDLSHVDHLHRDTLGQGGPDGAGTFTGVAPKIVRKGDDRLALRWSVQDARPRPLEQKAMALSPGEKVCRSTELLWRAPSVMTLSTTVEVLGSAVVRRFDNTHVVTPETAMTSHYFFSSTRDFAVDDEGLNAQIAATRRRIFLEEDEWMCRGVQDRMDGGDFWALRPALLKTDVASIQMRRMLDRLIAHDDTGRDRVRNHENVPTRNL